MTMSIEAMKRWLEVLEMVDQEDNDRDFLNPAQCYQLDKAITEIRQAIEQAEKQEPVAYIRKDQLQKATQSPLLCEVSPEPRQDRIGIYTSLPQRQPEQEPVAWVDDMCIKWLSEQHHENAYIVPTLTPRKNHNQRNPLYTSPPQRQWAGLTDEEIGAILDDPNIAEKHQGNWLVLPYAYARAIEAKLKEKNT